MENLEQRPRVGGGTLVGNSRRICIKGEFLAWDKQ